ncbi:MAG: HesB/IscA family protein [Candidatus Levyibacteriota bacterium]
MITVTPSAAQQIRIAATQSDSDEMGLRIAVRRDADGSLHYAMGFDEARNDDLVVTSEGVALVVSPGQRDLLDGMTLDYVEYEAGDFRFIFINPNEGRPAPQPPAASPQGCGGGCSCGGNAG